MASIKNTVHKSGISNLTINTNLLFQRLLATIDYLNEDNAKRAFSYELASYYFSLFDEQYLILMRKCVKSELYKLITSTLHSPATFESFKYVVDSGVLLRKVVWPHSKIDSKIFYCYLDYIVKHFGQDCVVVFDGYNEKNIITKSYES